MIIFYNIYNMSWNIKLNVIKTIKISLATLLAIILAKYLKLDNYLAAGIIAILSVLETNKSSIQYAFFRIISCVLAFLIAGVCFYVFGFNLFSFMLYLVIFVFSALILKISHGLAPISVLVTHLLLSYNISFNFLFNEFLLMFIGCICGVACNYYMPTHIKQLAKINDELEKVFKRILYTFEILLVNPDYEHTLDFDLDKAIDLIKSGINLAHLDIDNGVYNKGDYELAYFKMRKRQYHCLWNIKNYIIKIKTPYNANKIAEIFHLTSLKLHQYNDCVELLNKIDDVFDYYYTSELPNNRYEFEQRSMLFMTLNEFRLFLSHKREFSNDYRKYFGLID